MCKLPLIGERLWWIVATFSLLTLLKILKPLKDSTRNICYCTIFYFCHQQVVFSVSLFINLHSVFIQFKIATLSQLLKHILEQGLLLAFDFNRASAKGFFDQLWNLTKMFILHINKRTLSVKSKNLAATG